jgi:hypothetical protein
MADKCHPLFASQRVSVLGANTGCSTCCHRISPA